MRHLFILLVFIIFFLSIFIVPVRADWWNENWDSCKNVSFTENTIDRTNWPVTYNFTGLSLTNATNEIRIIDTYCNNGGNEIPSQVISSDNSTWAQVILLVNTTNESLTNYSIYYNNPDAEYPDYSTDISTSVTVNSYWFKNSYYNVSGTGPNVINLSVDNEGSGNPSIEVLKTSGNERGIYQAQRISTIFYYSYNLSFYQFQV